jgi:ABC-type lipoprotein export system ATPase subunit
MRPRLILADEPTGNLDRASSEQILKLLDQLHAQGQTLIMVTHEVDVARRAQRVLVIDDGQIVQRIKSEALVQDPVLHPALTQPS